METPNGFARFETGAGPGGRDVAFKIQIAPDSSFTVGVEKGQEEEETEDGAVVVRTGQYTRLTRAQAPVEPK